MKDNNKTQEMDITSLQHLRFMSTPEEWSLALKTEVSASTVVVDDFSEEMVDSPGRYTDVAKEVGSFVSLCSPLGYLEPMDESVEISVVDLEDE